MLNDVRQGVKLQDALSKLTPSTVPAPSGVAADAYNAGILHFVSAAFNTGIFAGKTSESAGTGNPAAAASAVGSGLQAVGQLMEGSSKYGKNVAGVSSPLSPTPVSDSSLKQLESSGKALGGAGGIISGAVGLSTGRRPPRRGKPAPPRSTPPMA